jgi:hypothetical protein
MYSYTNSNQTKLRSKSQSNIVNRLDDKDDKKQKLNRRSTIKVNIDDDILTRSLLNTITDKPVSSSSTLSSMSSIKKEIDLINASYIDNPPETKINDYNIQNLVSPKYELPTKNEIRSIFLSIDSRYRDRSYSIQNGLRFNLALNQNTSTAGIIGLNYPLDYVMEMEIMDSIIFPKKFTGSISYEDNSYFNEMTLLINEIYNQSYINPVNRFHFTFNITNYDTLRYKLPIPYNSIFKLAQPLNLDKTLTLSFFSPTVSANLDEDVLQFYVYYTNPATIEVAGPIDQTTGLIKSTLQTGDVIAFEDFNSTNYLYNSSNPSSLLYKENFYSVTNTTDQYTFTIPIDLFGKKLDTDPLAPQGNPYTFVKNVNFKYNGVYLSSNYLQLSFSQLLCVVGDMIIIKSVQSDRPPDYPANYSLLTRPSGWNIFLINYDTYNKIYLYVFDYDIINNPIWDPIPPVYISYVNVEIILNSKPAPVRTVNCYVGSRRIRIPIRFITKASE